MRTKSIIHLAFITAMLLAIPLVAMQFNREVNWTFSDFLAAGIVIFSTGLGYLALKSRSSSIYYRFGAGLAVVTMFMLVWSNMAVGFIGSGANTANIMYGGMVAVGIFGSIMARFRPAGMAYTVFALALAQVLIPLIALSVSDLSVEPGEAKAVAIITGIFVTLWIASGLLFRQAESIGEEQVSAK